MNGARRKQIEKAIDLIERAKDILDEVQSEEQDAYESVCERFPQSEQEARMSECLSDLEEAVISLEDAIGQATSAKS